MGKAAVQTDFLNSTTNKTEAVVSSLFSNQSDDFFISSAPLVQKTKGVGSNVLKTEEKPAPNKLIFLEEEKGDTDLFSSLLSKKEDSVDLFSNKTSSSLASPILLQAALIDEKSEEQILEEVKEIETRILRLYPEKNGQLFCESTQESLGLSFEELSKDLRNSIKSEKRWKMWRTKAGFDQFPRFITQKLGTGHFAKAYLVVDLEQSSVFVLKKGIAQKWRTDLSGKLVKMQPDKILASQMRANRQILNEFEVLSTIHKNGPIPGIQFKPHSYTSSFNVGKKEKTGLSTVRYDTNLSDLLKEGDFSIEKKYFALHQLAEGLQALHSPEINVVHGDIKPENIFVKGDDIFHLADFGGALLCQDPGFINKAKDASYTPLFSPSEDIIKEEEYAHRGEKDLLIDLQKKRDIFALGMVFYEVLHQKLPFESVPYSGHPNFSTFSPLPETSSISSDLRSLVHRMLAPTPEDRPTAEEVCRLLKALISS